MYNVTFSNPDTGRVIYSSLSSTCREDTCETDITPPSLSRICPSSTITVTANYELGQRLLSNPITIGMQILLCVLYLGEGGRIGQDVHTILLRNVINPGKCADSVFGAIYSLVL